MRVLKQMPSLSGQILESLCQKTSLILRHPHSKLGCFHQTKLVGGSGSDHQIPSTIGQIRVKALAASDLKAQSLPRPEGLGVCKKTSLFLRRVNFRGPRAQLAQTPEREEFNCSGTPSRKAGQKAGLGPPRPALETSSTTP